MSLPQCSGKGAWDQRPCSFKGKWEYEGRFYCELHRPDRVEHYRHAKDVRRLRDEEGKRIAEAVASGDDKALVAHARRYRELQARLHELWAEGRKLYRRFTREPMPLKMIRGREGRAGSPAGTE